MGIDSYIPLTYRPPRIPDAGEMVSLQNLVNQGQLQRQKLLEEQRQQQVRSSLQDLLRRPDATDNKGMYTLATIRTMDQIEPGMGQKALSQQQAQYERDVQTRAAQGALHKQVTDILDDINKRATESGAALEAKGVRDPGILNRTYSEAWQKELDQAKASGRFSFLLPEEVDRAVDEAKKNVKPYYEARAHALGPKETLAEPGKNLERESKIAAREKAADDRDRDANLREREFNLAKQREAFKEQVQAQGKDRPDRYRNRIIQAGNLAVGDIQNVVRLPITVNRGFLGGREQGKGLLSASAESLANTVTSQDAQIYNVMYAGLTRNLATIEAEGLAQQGALTHMMSGLDLKVGDTQLTKISKLAQVKQIVTRGLEPILSEPGVPESQKAQVKKIVQDFDKAVPWSQDDVITLMTTKNKRLSLSDAMRARKGKVTTTDNPPKATETVEPEWDDAAEKRLKELEEWDRKRRAK